jgi:hypothetical protein
MRQNKQKNKRRNKKSPSIRSFRRRQLIFPYVLPTSCSKGHGHREIVAQSDRCCPIKVIDSSAGGGSPLGILKSST